MIYHYVRKSAVSGMASCKLCQCVCVILLPY